MRNTIVLTLFCLAVTHASPQFGFGGGFVPRAQLPNLSGVSNLIPNPFSALRNLPDLTNVQNFAQFVVSLQ